MTYGAARSGCLASFSHHQLDKAIRKFFLITLSSCTFLEDQSGFRITLQLFPETLGYAYILTKSADFDHVQNLC